MKNDNSGCFSLIFWLLLYLGVSFLGYCFFMYVLDSDYPDWIKYALLH